MKGLDDVVLAALMEHPTTAVRPLVAALRDAGHEVTKSDVNAVLYRALERGAVVREGDSPPLWSLAGAEPMQHTTDPEWIIDRWLERTGEDWSPGQRAAAAQGARVLRLAVFTETELLEALDELAEERITWDAWQASAVAVRSRTIRV